MAEHNIPNSLKAEIPCKWERHGDMVLLPDHSFVSDQAWKPAMESILQQYLAVLHCKRVGRQLRIDPGLMREARVQMLVGEDGWVVHVDNHVKYSFDATKCMFSSGNITEKLRVASFDCSDQVVLDLYSGIGYFTLPYLVHAKAKHLHACEWNPNAVEALKRNLALNRVSV